MQHPKATPTQARAIGLDHRQHGTHGHRRIEGIATQLENRDTGSGGLRVGAGNRLLGRPCREYGGRQQQAQSKQAP